MKEENNEKFFSLIKIILFIDEIELTKKSTEVIIEKNIEKSSKKMNLSRYFESNIK